MRVAWSGRPEEALAVWRLRQGGEDVTLALQPDEVVPAFVLEAQAAAMGLAHAHATPERSERAPLAEAVAAGVRAVVIEARDPALLGKLTDEPGAEDGLRALAIEGPGFARRVDVVAGEARPHGGGWRLEIGLRGC